MQNSDTILLSVISIVSIVALVLLANSALQQEVSSVGQAMLGFSRLHSQEGMPSKISSDISREKEIGKGDQQPVCAQQ